MAELNAARADAGPAVRECFSRLPDLIPHRPRGLPDMLELATRAAVTVGARDEISGLAAARGGSRLLTEARRLHTTLTR